MTILIILKKQKKRSHSLNMQIIWQDYPVEVCWVSETPDREKLALLIQAAAQEVGMTVDVVQTPWTSVVENSSSVETTPNVTTTLFCGRLL